MYIHGFCTSCLTLVARTIIRLSEHYREIAHRRFPLLRYRVGFWGKREGVLALGVSQTLGKVSHGVVQRQTSYGQFRLFRLFLLVLSCTLLGSPFVLLLLIHFVHLFHFRSPCINHGVDTSLTGCEITGNVRDEVQRVHLTVHSHLYSCSQHSDGWTDGGNHWHCQGWSYGIDRITHTLRHLRQSIEIEHFVLGISLVQRIHQSLAFCISSSIRSTLFQLFLSQSGKHIFQSLRHLRNLLIQRRVDASHLLLLRETIVAGDDLIHQAAVEATDVAQVHGKLEGQSVAVGANWFVPIIIHQPPLRNDFGIWDSEVIIAR